MDGTARDPVRSSAFRRLSSGPPEGGTARDVVAPVKADPARSGLPGALASSDAARLSRFAAFVVRLTIAPVTINCSAAASIGTFQGTTSRTMSAQVFVSVWNGALAGGGTGAGNAASRAGVQASAIR